MVGFLSKNKFELCSNGRANLLSQIAILLNHWSDHVFDPSHLGSERCRADPIRPIGTIRPGKCSIEVQRVGQIGLVARSPTGDPDALPHAHTEAAIEMHDTHSQQ